jgi:tetratricopeptide (TPR) repeat protein
MERRVYLKQESIRVGVGSTAKTQTVEDYYEVVEIDDNRVEALLLDIEDQPVGRPSIMTKEELKDYVYCPDYFNKGKETQDLKELIVEKRIQLGDKYFGEKKFFTAENQYNKALALDEDSLRASLGKGKTLYARGEKKEGAKVFSTLSKNQALFENENKHIFNEFGIELRKKGMLEEAISHYLKAISIDPNDEVLYYNLGRTFYEQGKQKEAVEQLKIALVKRPDFKDAKEFLSKMQMP